MPSKPHFAEVAEADLWTPASHPREALAEALVQGGVAGLNSHDRSNMLWKIARLGRGDPDVEFGLTGVSGLEVKEVLGWVAEAGGLSPDPDVREGPVEVDPHRVLDAFEAIGDRLALAAERGEGVVLATGHPAGLILLYQATGRLLSERGAKLLRPLEGRTWTEDWTRKEIRYLDGVAVLTIRESFKHTHSPEPMNRMLEEAIPDLVFADHGFAGAAIELGIDTVSIADINDPALVVANRQGRGGPVVVMDDNVQPEAYWPCFQVIAARFDR